MVAFTRSIERAASASIAMIKSGFTFFTTPKIISLVSIPVIPITPGTMALTGLKPSCTLSGCSSNKCLVINKLSTAFGPSASGVTLKFPRPTTRQLASSGMLRLLIKKFSSLANTSSMASCFSVSCSRMPTDSRVTYRPFFLPIASAPSSVISTIEILTPCSSFSFTITPLISD